MSVFNGGGGDLISTNLPSALLEVSLLLLNVQKAFNSNFEIFSVKLVSITTDFNIRKSSIILNIPSDILSTALIPTQFQYSSKVFFQTVLNSFNTGIGGTLNVISKTEAILQIAQLLYQAEINYLSIYQFTKIIYASNLTTINISLPIATYRDLAGNIIVSAIDYLP